MYSAHTNYRHRYTPQSVESNRLTSLDFDMHDVYWKDSHLTFRFENTFMHHSEKKVFCCVADDKTCKKSSKMFIATVCVVLSWCTYWTSNLTSLSLSLCSPTPGSALLSRSLTRPTAPRLPRMSLSNYVSTRLPQNRNQEMAIDWIPLIEVCIWVCSWCVCAVHYVIIT